MSGISRRRNALAARLYRVRRVATVVFAECGRVEDGRGGREIAPLSEIGVEYVAFVMVLVAVGIEVVN